VFFLKSVDGSASEEGIWVKGVIVGAEPGPVGTIIPKIIGPHARIWITPTAHATKHYKAMDVHQCA
jgi:hypothetical protein